jgi:UDP-glucose 4-epimerase
MTILVTGAAAYIGSHTLVTLLEAGQKVVALGNYCNSKPEAFRRVAEIAGKTFPIYRADVRERTALDPIFVAYRIDAAIHFAGLKTVDESVQEPLAITITI